jgi:hypothetical protein
VQRSKGKDAALRPTRVLGSIPPPRQVLLAFCSVRFVRTAADQVHSREMQALFFSCKTQ